MFHWGKFNRFSLIIVNERKSVFYFYFQGISIKAIPKHFTQYLTTHTHTFKKVRYFNVFSSILFILITCKVADFRGT